MQYAKPDDADHWVGDCMPFYHDGIFHLFYLLDEGHHQALDGQGGHQWAHATSPDLIQWTHHPLALSITDETERSICTGSVFHHGDTYYAFHAVRRPDWSQRLGIAVSTDGITFAKQPVPPYAEPPAGYDPLHFRDPFVFFDPASQRFHMLVTTNDTRQEMPALGGCLAHLVSDDLDTWHEQPPLFFPGFTDPPECADYFAWNGWYYLLFSNQLQTRYRLARTPFGPWQRPALDLLDSPWARVMKTAPYRDNRRIGAAWIGTRLDDSDRGRFQWGGHVILRDLVQHVDGTLGTKFVPEMIPASGPPLSLSISAQTTGVTVTPDQICLDAGQGMAAVSLAGLPANGRIRVTAVPEAETPRFGVRMRETAPFVDGVTLDLLAVSRRVELHDAALDPVMGLDAPFTLDIVVKDDLFDVCLDDRHCLINRCPQQRGQTLTLFCHTGSVVFENLSVRPLLT